MNQIRKYYLPGFLLLVILYLYFSYSREPNTQQAYLYDPNSDDIYIVELVQELDEFNKYSFLNPFKNDIHGLKTGACWHYGNMKERLENAKLMAENWDAWYDKFTEETDQLSSSTTNSSQEAVIQSKKSIKGPLEVTLLWINLFSRDIRFSDEKLHMESLKEYMPKGLADLFISDNKVLENSYSIRETYKLKRKMAIEDTILVDAVVSEQFFSLNEYPLNKPAKIKIIKPAILFKGEAFSLLSMSGI